VRLDFTRAAVLEHTRPSLWILKDEHNTPEFLKPQQNQFDGRLLTYDDSPTLAPSVSTRASSELTFCNPVD